MSGYGNPQSDFAPRNLNPEAGAGYGGGYGGFTEFTEISLRQGFIRKVYGILLVQLSITAGFIAMFMYVEPVKLWTAANPGFFFGVLILSLVVMFSLVCCESVRRQAPMNFIFLFIFTLCEGFLLGAAASTYKADSVILAVVVTAVVCLAITLFSFQTKMDFTGAGGYLLVAAVVLMLFGFIAIFLRGTFPILNIIYACVGALLFSFYLVFDTQLLIGGKHKYSISPEEYIFAALSIYLDIINIFIFLLQIIDAMRN